MVSPPLVVFVLIEIDQITGIVAASKHDMPASGVAAEHTKHLWSSGVR